ncbi:MAG: polymorphic outer membrane protein [Phycisphaerales bacterium]|nr:polymorphic outer membrane protein [Phycisphaerales bacterium]
MIFGPGGGLTYGGVASLTLNTPNSTTGDSIYLSPSATTAFTINAGSPVPPTASGDTLTIAGVGVTNPLLISGGGGAGQYTFSNRMPVTFTGIEQTSIDSIAPVVVSINRSSPAGPNIAAGVVTSVSYAVTFSEPVTGVTAAEFALAFGGGVTASTPVVVSGSGASYTVTINNINGAGTLGLNLLSDGTIKDIAGNPIPSGTGFTGQLYTVTATPPVVAAFTIPAAVEGTATSSVNGSFTGQAGDSFTATVDYGEGAGPQALSLTGNAFTLSHAYAEGGSYTVSVVVTDTTTHLTSAASTASVSISDAQIQVSIMGAPATTSVGGSINLNFVATNPDLLEMGPLIESWTITDASSNVVASGTGGPFTFTPAAAGVYTVNFSAGESVAGDAETGTAMATVTVNPAPAYLGTQIDDGNRQRSVVRSLTFSFSTPVTLSAGAITLALSNAAGSNSGTNDGAPPTNASAALGTPTTSDGGRTWVVPFLKSVAGFTDGSGSLVDGVYTATVHSNLVTDAFGQHLTGVDPMKTFHRLFGDINGDKRISNADFTFFSNAFGATFGQPNYNRYFDFAGTNGKISNADFTQFSNRFGKSFVYTGN